MIDGAYIFQSSTIKSLKLFLESIRIGEASLQDNDIK